MQDIKTQLEELFIKYDITGVTCDSRQVHQGYAYFAIAGSKQDGNNFINSAREKNAKLIFTDKPNIKSEQGLDDVILVEDSRYALAIAASIIYPSLPHKLVAVTGTNGKTSVASYCYSILAAMGVKAAALGTLGIETNCYDSKAVSKKSSRAKGQDGDEQERLQERLENKIKMDNGGLTTADPVAFRRNLHELSNLGAEVIIFEASSHGIDQGRLGDVQLDSAAFISFSQDHLDYHGTMENYLKSKLKLFHKHLKPGAKAVLPSDINNKQDIFSFFKEHNISTSIIGAGTGTGTNIDDDMDHSTVPSIYKAGDLQDRISVKITGIDYSIHGQKINFSYSDGDLSSREEGLGNEYTLNIPVIGSFQASNVMISIELLRLIGYGKERIIAAAGSISGVRGRLQKLSNITDNYHVFVDYAHTPDALEKSLIELNKLKDKSARLILVFGCGGDRDKGKRPLMGKIAAAIADVIIVTDDNPRYEDANTIRQEIILGMKEEGAKFEKPLYEISSRSEAIEKSIRMMQKADIVLIAGKGHEDYQIVKGNTSKFCDISTAQTYINKYIKTPKLGLNTIAQE